LDSGYYAACSALKTQTNALEIAANNIANVSTAGYRGQVPSFQALLAQNGGPRMGAWERLVNEHAVLNGSRLDLGQGNLEPTGNPMDFAISGPDSLRFRARPEPCTRETEVSRYRPAGSW
jgi:flagellar hook-basal body protein